MSISWHELQALDVTVRPFDGTPPACAYRRSLFLAPLRKTVVLLARELRELRAKRVVLELDLSERDIRLDGWPRADARPASPAVVLSFESKHGPLRYATAEYSDWQDNLRAIALSMEALRSVDRYGVSKRGEQYRGWRAIEAKSAEPADFISTREQAKAFLDEHGGSFKAAAAKFHPDKGGDPKLFRAAVRARELVEATP